VKQLQYKDLHTFYPTIQHWGPGLSGTGYVHTSSELYAYCACCDETSCSVVGGKQRLGGTYEDRTVFSYRMSLCSYQTTRCHNTRPHNSVSHCPHYGDDCVLSETGQKYQGFRIFFCLEDRRNLFDGVVDAFLRGSTSLCPRTE
jgi:hypothetical protein